MQLLPRRRFRALLLAVLLGFGLPLTVLLAGPASAHAKLVSITPADGATVATPPTQVVVTFDDTVTPGFSVVAVTSQIGAIVSTGKPAEDKGVVTQQLAADLPGGSYTIAWKVLSDDGHPISGTARFTVQTDAATPLASGTSSAVAAPSPSSAESSISAGSPTSGATAAPDTGIFAGGGQGVLTIVALAAIIYGVLGVLRGRRRQRQSTRSTHGDGV